MEFSGQNVAKVLERGWGAFGVTNPYDGVSAVSIDPDGMVRSLLPVGRGFALYAELGGRAANLLFPLSRSGMCAHGLVKAEREPGWPGGCGCGCGFEPIDRNPIRKA